MKTPTDTDRLDIKSWAEGQADELRMAIKSYLDSGWNKQTAIDTVLNNSCIGSGYKAQIRYEFKSYEKRVGLPKEGRRKNDYVL